MRFRMLSTWGGRAMSLQSWARFRGFGSFQSPILSVMAGDGSKIANGPDGSRLFAASERLKCRDISQIEDSADPAEPMDMVPRTKQIECLADVRINLWIPSLAEIRSGWQNLARGTTT